MWLDMHTLPTVEKTNFSALALNIVNWNAFSSVDVYSALNFTHPCILFLSQDDIWPCSLFSERPLSLWTNQEGLDCNILFFCDIVYLFLCVVFKYHYMNAQAYNFASAMDFVQPFLLVSSYSQVFDISSKQIAQNSIKISCVYVWVCFPLFDYWIILFPGHRTRKLFFRCS